MLNLGFSKRWYRLWCNVFFQSYRKRSFWFCFCFHEPFYPVYLFYLHCGCTYNSKESFFGLKETVLEFPIRHVINCPSKSNLLYCVGHCEARIGIHRYGGRSACIWYQWEFFGCWYNQKCSENIWFIKEVSVIPLKI